MADSVDQASIRIKAAQENIAGVRIPKFDLQTPATETSKTTLTGLGRGGQQVQP